MKRAAWGVILWMVVALWAASSSYAQSNTSPAAIAKEATARQVHAYDSAAKPRSAELRLLRITPEGTDVPVGREVVFQFDRPVVPLGRMERTAEEIPIVITPALKCEWRWLDTSALACRLKEEDALAPATRYEVAVDLGIKAQDGAAMPTPLKHHFVTQRPQVKFTRFLEWRAPGWPRIQVTFDQPVSRSSVEKCLRFWLPKTRKPMALDAASDQNDRDVPRLLPLPGENLSLDTTGAQSPVKVDERLTRIKNEEARRIWVVSPASEMALDAEVLLNVDPGLVSALGPEKGAERRTVVSFHTFPPFRFLGVSCIDSISRTRVTIPPAVKTEAKSNRCAPLDFVALLFSAPVIQDAVKAHVAVSPDLAGGRTDYDPWANQQSYSRLKTVHRRGQSYEVDLPERLKAFQRYTLKSKSADLKDEFGRRLDQPIDMAFMTAHRDPEMVLVHSKATLEKQEATDMALHVTNLDSVEIRHRTLTADGFSDRLRRHLPVADIEDVAFAMPMGIRELLENRSGAVSGVLDSSPRISNYAEEYFRFFAQITPFQVHVKLGHFNTLAWVTDLATGEPIKDAEVSIYVDNYTLSKSSSPHLAQASTDAQGICLLPGIETLDSKLQTWSYYYYDESENRIFVRVKKGADLALVPLDNDFMTYPGGVGRTIRPKNGHMRAWGTTAQGIYKAGDTIQYKVYVRNQDNRRWVLPRLDGYTLRIIDPMGRSVEEIKELKLSPVGAFDGEFKLTAQAAVGWYRFEVRPPMIETSLEALRVLVSDFTPAPFRLSAELNGERFEPGDHVRITALAKLHAGGPYAAADTRITAMVRRGYFSSKDPRAEGFFFDSGPYDQREQRQVHQSSLTGSDQGEAMVEFDLEDQQIIYGRLTAEAAVRDDRGKYTAASVEADYYGRDRFVGLRNTRWTYEEDQPAEIEYLVVDMDGKPQSGVPVQLLIQRQETRAARVKGAGNAYLTNYVTEWVETGRFNGASAEGPAVCRFTPDTPGRYQITASVEDSKGRTHTTILEAWVIGRGGVVWQEEDNYNLQIIPEKGDYKVGDTARFLIKNPFPGATALITVERYGVIEHFTRILENGTPVIEVTVTPDFLPGVYLSVLVVSPRVDKPISADNVDLGKPTFRLGYLQVPVKDVYKEIEVSVKPDQEVYKPRQIVKAAIVAKPRNGAEGRPIEIAVAVIDEAVFDLNRSGRSYYDPYAGFNSLENLDLSNYSLLARLVGRQRFEKKGDSPGGDGGAPGDPALRNLFKFVSYWNPSITPDAEGRAVIEFQAPDNLTGWRIFAMAVTPDDRMGLGDAGFKVNRPTELRPVMPNQILEGDAFSAGFSVMNRTGQPRELTVKLEAKGEVLADSGPAQSNITLRLEPFKRENVWLPVKTKGFGEIRFAATAGDAIDSDGLEHILPVRKRRSLLTAANYGTTTATEVTEPVAFPQGIFPDVGGISVTASPSVIGNVAGAFGYIRDYPYMCWEQRLTKGVMAAHYQHLKAYLPDDFKWEESRSLPQQTLDDAAAFQAPGGAMAYWVADDAYACPYLSAYTALAFNWLRADGYQVPQQVEEKLHGYLLQMLAQDVLPSFYTEGMASSVRAVALAALAEHGDIGLNDLRRYQPHVARMDLFGKAHFLQAAARVKGGRDAAFETARMILAHAGQSGGKVQFNEVLDDSYSYMLATPLRSNSAILSSLLKLATDDEGTALVGDLPFKIVRAITQSRGNRDHWENTQENIFCLNALVDFSRVYESETPEMTVKAFAGERAIGQARFNDLRDEAVTLADSQGAVPGLSTEVRLTKEGPGRLYYATRVQYAPTEENAQPINAGIEIRREYAVERNGRWVLLQSPMQIRRGELVRVDLFVSLSTLRHFVVVDDPVPGGLEPVNRDLATASIVDADKGSFTAAAGSWWFSYSDWSYYGNYGYSFYHKELRHDSARFYADYLPAGNYHLSYTAQAIAAGSFAVMPVHAEEMYDPDVFGKGVPATLEVAEQAD